ncbi:SERTA domain-containing protein 2-like [Centroberyx affinis]|uniref:SERTA domain-containing protein 2-like n=1 Tax=Centroberyx affinis TaxID=166261 RepID=UPI003A5C5A0C
MLGNGVKRKLDEDEDGLEEDRGLLGVGGAGQASYTLQRQTVLNMSLMKLYGPRTGADLGLQRRVLINNVVRRIHDDFRQEGAVGALFFSVPSAAPAAAAAAAAREDQSHRQPPPPPPSFGVLSALDSCLTPASLLEEDLPLFFTLPPSSSSSSSPHHHLTHLTHSPRPPPSPSPSPKDSFSSALEEIEELCPSSSSASSSSSGPPSSPPPAARVLFADVVMKEEGRGSQEEEIRLEKLPAPPPPPPCVTDSSSSSPGGFLTDFALDDVLFTDIDTSMYDFGPCPPPPGAPPSKMAPVVMADELVRSMSGYGGAGAGSAQNQPFKMDLAELDHIMEVLVGS